MLLLEALLMGSMTAHAGVTKVDANVFVAGDEFTPVITVYTAQPLGDSGFSGFVFGLALPAWGEAYAGLSYAPADWASFSLGAGLETTPGAPWRVGSSACLGDGRWSLVTIGEWGGSGGWYKVVGGFAATDWLTVGAMSQRYRGHGPRIDVGGKHVTVYASALWSDSRIPTGHGGFVVKW